MYTVRSRACGRSLRDTPRQVVEQAVLNRIPLRAVRRVVGHANLDAKPVRQRLKVVFEQDSWSALAARHRITAVVSWPWDSRPGRPPPSTPRDCHRPVLPGVVAGIEVRRSPCSSPHRRGRGGSPCHPHCRSRGRWSRSSPGCRSCHRGRNCRAILLLGVHAVDWQAGLQILLLQTGDVLELGVADRIAGTYRLRKYSVNPSPALAFSRSDGYSRPSWTTDQPPCSVSRPCGSQSRNWHPSPLVRHRIPRHRNPFVPPRLSPSAPVRFARG